MTGAGKDRKRRVAHEARIGLGQSAAPILGTSGGGDAMAMQAPPAKSGPVG